MFYLSFQTIKTPHNQQSQKISANWTSVVALTFTWDQEQLLGVQDITAIRTIETWNNPWSATHMIVFSIVISGSCSVHASVRNVILMYKC